MPNRAYPIPGSKPRFFYGYVIVAAVFLIQFVIGAAFNTFGIFFTPLQSEFGWSSAVTSAVASLAAISYGLVTIISGRLYDRFGPRKVMLASGIVLAAGFILSSQVHHIWQIYLFAGIMTGAGTGGSWVPSVTIIPHWFVKRRGLMTGIVLGGVAIGGFVGALAVSRLIEIFDWRMTYIIKGAAILIIMIPAALLLRRNPAEKGQQPYGEKEDIQSEFPIPAKSYSWRETLHTSQFWLFLGVMVCFGYFVSSFQVHIVPFSIDIGKSSLDAANLLAINMGISIVGNIGLGSLADKTGYRPVFIITLILCMMIFVGLAYARELWMLYLISLVFGCAHGGLATLEVPFLARLFGLSSLGIICGIVEAGLSFGSAIGPFATGFIFDTAGNYQPAFLACGILAIAGLIFILLIRPIKNAI